jgi:hypothetical protein
MTEEDLRKEALDRLGITPSKPELPKTYEYRTEEGAESPIQLPLEAVKAKDYSQMPSEVKPFETPAILVYTSTQGELTPPPPTSQRIVPKK